MIKDNDSHPGFIRFISGLFQRPNQFSMINGAESAAIIADIIAATVVHLLLAIHVVKPPQVDDLGE